MRLATLLGPDGPVAVRVEGDSGVVIPEVSLLDLIDLGAEGLALAARASGPRVALEPERWLAPIPLPRRNIVCLGLNYADLAAESARARGRPVSLPEVPLFFTKATHTVNGPYAPIPFDASVSSDIDWEAELAVVIGRRGKNIARAESRDYIFGYAVLNDVSARDLQTAHGQFFKGKSLDGACPLGPWIVTADELPDPLHLPIRCRVNGVVKQESNTDQLIFDVPAIVEWLSRGLTLDPGDIIATGTPGGVGFARTPPEFLKPGDVVETEIEGIGMLRNPVVATGESIARPGA
jgi:2-keto-4-pentenoate hydratase/2-oxohepta-3-ene-1,7-dioic acid hydratase in catechol pathway